MDATKASSGSTWAGFDHGTGTAEGEDDAGTVTPPSKDQVCSREYFPREKPSLVRFQTTVARCSDIKRLRPLQGGICLRAVLRILPAELRGKAGRWMYCLGTL